MSAPRRAISPSAAPKSTWQSMTSTAVRLGAIQSAFMKTTSRKCLAQPGQDFSPRNAQALDIVVIDEHQAVDIAVAQESLDLGGAGGGRAHRGLGHEGALGPCGHGVAGNAVALQHT